MHLTLFVPDLLWPDVEHTAAFDFPNAQNLARFLALAESAHSPMDRTASWESCLAVLFGFTEKHSPLAVLRSLGDGLPETSRLVCADPVNLDFMQQALVLSPIPAFSLSSADAQSLLENLNEEFSGEGHFITAPGEGNICHWYFVPAVDTVRLPDLAACSRLAGRRIDADETRELLGREGLSWINRIQMCLNQHPVNQKREAAGLPLINSLWPWGAGSLDQHADTHFSAASGHAALLRGLCQVTRTPLTLPSKFESGSGHRLVVALDLATAIEQDDLAGWQSAITVLITDWIEPALAALSDTKGVLQSLTLISPNAHVEHRWSLHRTHKALRHNTLQRWLGMTRKIPPLSALVRSWSA